MKREKALPAESHGGLKHMTSQVGIEDLSRIARIISSLIKPEASAGKMLYRNPRQIRSMLASGQGIYSTDQCGDPVSFCGYYVYDGFVEIGSTITHPDFRGRGLATDCLYSVLQMVSSLNQQIVAFCNAESAKLFGGAGFEEQPKGEMPAEAMEFCHSCAEFSDFPGCHCRYMTFTHQVARIGKGLWQTIIHDPAGDTLAKCAELYCQVWTEPPWDENDWNLAEVMASLGQLSRDASAIFIMSLARGNPTGFTIGYPLSASGLAAKGGTQRLAGLCRGCGEVFYIADLGVSSTNRGLGLGQMLSEKLLAEAEDRGYTRFVLRTDVNALPARILYTKLGFSDTGIADANYPSRTYWIRNV